jgi:hypothetical protein
MPDGFFSIGNCAGKDTFFRFNTKHGLGLEAWSVSLLPPAPIARNSYDLMKIQIGK